MCFFDPHLISTLATPRKFSDVDVSAQSQAEVSVHPSIVASTDSLNDHAQSAQSIFPGQFSEVRSVLKEIGS